MKTFNRFLETKMYLEAVPSPGSAPSGVSSPGMLPGGPPPSGIGGGGMPPPMGGMPPPMGGSLGGMGMPPPMGGAPAGPQGAAPKLKSYNVWDVLERIMGNQPNQNKNQDSL